MSLHFQARCWSLAPDRLFADFARPTIAIPHPHEKTGYKAGMEPPPPLPSTYKGAYKGWQQDYYTTMKDNVPYKPLAARSRLPVRALVWLCA